VGLRYINKLGSKLGIDCRAAVYRLKIVSSKAVNVQQRVRPGSGREAGLDHERQTWRGGEMIVLRIWFVCLLGGLWVSQSLAQELTPRLFWPSPKGTKVLVTGYAYTRGDVLFDQSVPIEGADSSFNTGILAYAQTLGLWGRTSNVLIELPYAWGTTQGQL